MSGIAVAQTSPRKGDVEGNIVEHVRLAQLAAEGGAEIVVFPELSLTGYEIALAPSLAFAEDDARLIALVDAAASLGVTIVAGAPVTIGARLHIGAFILGPDRSTDIYTKRRLGAFPASAASDGAIPPAEASVFEALDRDPPVRWGNDHAAVAVCADVGDPAHAERAAARGSRALLASMFVIPSEYDGEALRLEGMAGRHGMRVAMANFGAGSGGLASAGKSSIWSASGRLLLRLPKSGSGVGIVDREDHARAVLA